MDRRQFSLGALAAVASFAPRQARASFNVFPNGAKQVFVSRPTVVKQQCPEWCWAASIAMIFGMWGHSVDQKTIVSQAFGNLPCAPAPSGLAIAQNLSRPWIDQGGAPFNSQISAAYDFTAGVNFISNAFIVNELMNDRPIIYANKHHAMVLVMMEYYDTPNGPVPISTGVLDPWPGSPDYHPLSPAEMTVANLGGEMTFLAAVNIS